MAEQKKKITVDIAKIKMAIRAGIPLSITTYTLPKDMEDYMNSVLAAFLDELNQHHMIEYLTYCLNELMTNSKKANTKRVYFREKNLDINNDADYAEGMKDFKVHTLNNINYYLQQQKAAGLYIKLVLQTRNGKIKVEVRNNTDLTINEYKRMHDKLSRAQQYTSPDQAFSQILDDSEGAGLGLIIMILMLEKIGLTEENFQIVCENGETITRIILPLNETTQKNIAIVSHEFVKVIDELPQFPESISRLTNLINNPNSKLSEIAATISSDVSLTTDLLKLVNSATFALASPCRGIADAVKMIGIGGIRNLLLSVGSMSELKKLAPESKKALWSHAHKVAFFSYNLARNFCTDDPSLQEDSYICGLLHDMGKLIFNTARPELVERIRKIGSDKGVPMNTFEKLVAGVNHGELGALIAEKWNFPENIIKVIRHHHEPELAPQEVRKLTSLVYLSDMMVHYVDHEVDFYQFDKDVINMFGLRGEQQLSKICDRLSSAFKKNNVGQ
ncbi:MAG: HDOD domain-containing protein [Treponema sp.]|nr:HDOD domain-containing protein [Treponema sp.]